jgi:predicted RNase H-like nuclease (RuvC/YqgF family)
MKDCLDLIHRLQAESERLTERVFDCTAVMEYNEKCSKEIQAATILLEKRNNENAELQKQVDELKEELALQKTLYSRAREAGYCTGYKSAVKDTAKEIFETIFYDCWAIKDENGYRVFVEGKIKDFAKKCYGVEVE